MLMKMQPRDGWVENPNENWCLADDRGESILLYSLAGPSIKLLHPAAGFALWFDPRTGETKPAIPPTNADDREAHRRAMAVAAAQQAYNSLSNKEVFLRFLISLLIVANAFAAGPYFNVLDYGAKRDGSAKLTAAIRSAIQAAHQAGGGTVYIPAGKYLTGPIELVSNLVLDIDAGAVLQFEATREGLTLPKAGSKAPIASRPSL